MKLQLVVILGACIAFAASQVLPKPPPPQVLSGIDTNPHLPKPRLESDRLRHRAVDLAFEWNKAFCKGAKLTMGMIKDEAQAAGYVTPVRSPWDGDLAAAFRAWGYKEMPGHRDNLCNFGPGQHDLQRAFEELNIDTRSSADGGPNICYHIEHKNGPTVERDPSGGFPEPSNQYYTAGGRRMRVTEAYSTIGINPTAGALFFLNRKSPAQAAHENWGIPLESVQKKFLPDLSSSSDHAWGFWNRAKVGGDLANIKMIFTCMITNDITTALIAEAFKKYTFPPGVARPLGVERWPGTTFEIQYDAAQVLLGSPNGQAVGYFLAQHKHRFGRSKTVEKVTVFRADKGILPYILFWVIDTPARDLLGGVDTEHQDGGSGVETNGQDSANGTERKAQYAVSNIERTIVKHSADGKNVLREHVFRARL